MNKWLLSFIAAALVASSFLAGAGYTQRTAALGNSPVKGAIHEGRRILYYKSSMDPTYRSDKPGNDGMGMALVPVYGDTPSGSAEASGSSPSVADSADASAPAAGSVHISARQQHRIGLETETVTTAAGVQTLRVLGKVAVDEARIYPLVAATDGWVRQSGPIVSGDIVQKDDLLATFYNREFLTAEQTYLYALDTMDRFKKAGESESQLNLTRGQIRVAEENLESLGMLESQRHDIERTRQVAQNIEFRAPVAGLVVARKAFSGMRFARGDELFRIADIHQVWVLASVFENDARAVRSAQSAKVRYLDREFPARISKTLPQFDPEAHALAFRLEVDNPAFVLRPDMFVEVEFQLSLPPGIAVPLDAVIDSGLRKTVYVQTADGSFTPRPVETGWRTGDTVQITKGLMPGERIVVAGNFLLDSETQMKLGGAP